MASAATVPPQETAPLSEGQRLAYTFVAPSKAFTDLRRNAAWWAPFLILVIVSLSFSYVVDQKVGFRKVVENTSSCNPSRRSVSTSCPPSSARKAWGCRSRSPK